MSVIGEGVGEVRGDDVSVGVSEVHMDGVLSRDILKGRTELFFWCYWLMLVSSYLTVVICKV